jgi:hypothetical protein
MEVLEMDAHLTRRNKERHTDRSLEREQTMEIIKSGNRVLPGLTYQL